MRIRLQDLEEQLGQKQEVIDSIGEMTDRNRNFAKLLVHLEKKNQSLTDIISEREGQVQDLMDKMKKTKDAKEAESKALVEKNQLVVEKLKATVGALTTKLAEVTEKPEEAMSSDETCVVDTASELQSLAKYKAFTEEKIETLEEMVQAYKTASNDLRLQCISLEDQVSNKKSSGSVADTELKICMLEVKLEASERVKECLEKEIVLLASSNANNMKRVGELEDDVTNYEIKVRNLEEGYYTMTSQLIERTKLLHDAIAVRGDAQEENKHADS
jgi:chromosome segregation ATPase